MERSDEVEIIAEYAVLDLDRGAIGLSHPWILLVSKEALTAPSYAVRPTSGKDLQIKLPRTLKPGLGWKLSSEGLAHCEEVSSLAAQPSRVALSGSDGQLDGADLSLAVVNVMTGEVLSVIR
ncbi:MAG: hypothetical protein AMXMBFR34_46720 [Myxococcaceae bacterium]